jgi:hypothetical protein
VEYSIVQTLRIEVFDKDLIGKESLGFIEFNNQQSHGVLHGGPLTKGGVGTIDFSIWVDNEKLSYAGWYW